MSVLLIFIDGIGIGQEEPSLNPFACVSSPLSRFRRMDEEERIRRDAFFKKIALAGQQEQDDIMESVEGNAIVRYPGFRQIFSNYRHFLLEKKSCYESSPWETSAVPQDVFKEIDPRMDVQGIPQSASGQASILTGLNVPGIIGYHLQGLPDKKVRELISRESIFLKLSSMGFRVTFANAFTDGFFKRKSPRISATTHAALSGGVDLRMVKDVQRGKAVYQDYTNFFLKEMGYDVELLSPEKAGENLASLSAEFDFTLYEHFLTDLIGHRGDMDEGEAEVLKLRSFLYSVLRSVDLSETLVIVTSDHGNLEDMSLKTHTLNPVPLLCWGKQKEAFLSAVQTISDIGKNIISFLRSNP